MEKTQRSINVLENLLKTGLLGLSALIISCANVSVPNIEVCTVAGNIQLGSVCANTLSDETRDLSFEETIEFLEPSEIRGGALFLSASDFNKLKTALEQACVKNKCRYERQMFDRIEGLIDEMVKTADK
jgi:hypothetical protein